MTGAAILPEEGEAAEQLLERLEGLRASDMPTRGGRAWQYSYDPGREGVGELAERAFLAGLGANALDPTAFPSVPALENEVVAMIGGLLGAGPETAGTFTSGGTESIMLALKAARDARPEVDRAEVVLPATAHAAFRKSAHYLGMDVVEAPVDPATFRAEPEGVAAAIGDRTALVVCSAYSYAHGAVDPVREIASAAAERGVPCHVDACVGGLVLPFWREIGEPVEDFDLSVPGVASISADIHKFGYSPKGASVVLFDGPDRRRRAYYACARWTGYTLINTTVQSSRSGGPLAAAWAVLRHLGREGYLQAARDARRATAVVRDGVAGIDGLRVLGEPRANAMAIASEDEDVDVFVVSDILRSGGWFMTPQLSYGPSPRNLNLIVDAGGAQGADGLVAALAAAAAEARERGRADPDPALLDLIAGVDPAGLDTAGFASLLERLGVAVGEGGMATINNLLDSASPAVREALLVGFMGTIFPPGPAAAGSPP